MSDLLYGYTRLKIDLKPEWFTHSDKQLKGFVDNLIKVPREEIKDINSWCGVDIHTPISKIAFENKLYTSLFTEKVNIQNLQNSAALLQGDWAFLQEQFPDLAGLPRETKLKTADQFDDEESTYKSFFPEWDKVFYGLLPGDLIYLFSLPKFGKSSVAAHWAYMGLANGYKVGFYNTELDSKTTQKAIFGYNKSLKYNEAMVFFQKHPHEYKLIKEKFGKNLVMPPNLVFEWAVLEDMYKAGCDLVIVDNQVSCLASLGIEESPQSMGELTRKFSTMQKKYNIPTIIVTQEAAREASAKELETDPNRLEYGKGTTRSSRAPIQEASLALRMVKQNSHSLVRNINVVADRYRSKLDPMSSYEIVLNSRSEMQVEIMRDSIDLAIARAEKQMAEDPITEEIGASNEIYKNPN
jgi:hypothetical protein